MSSDDRVDRRYWLEPNVGWSEELDLIAIETQPVCTKRFVLRLLTLIDEGEYKTSVIPALDSLLLKREEKNKLPADTTLYLHGVYRLESKNLPLIVISESQDFATMSVDQVLKDRVATILSEHNKKVQEYEKLSEDRRLENKSWFEEMHPDDPEKVRNALLMGELFGDQGAPSYPDPPRVDDELMAMLPAVEWVSPLIEGEEAFQVQEAVGGPGSTGSRDGKYEALRMKGVDGEPGLLVLSWAPSNDEVASFPELKAALEDELPSAFRKPRSTIVTPPKFPGVVTLDDTTFVDLDGIQDQWGQALERFLGDIGRDGWDDEAKKARAAIKENGIEALGWYQSFHIWDEEHWGIYLHLDRIMATAWALSGGSKSRELPFWRAPYLLTQFVLQHELFHAKTEAALTWLELGALKKKYLKYKNDVYENARGKEFWREEALANWEAMQWLKENCKNREEIRIFEMLFELSPPGYSNWEDGDDVWTWRSFATELVEGVPFDSDGRRPLPLEGLLRQMAGFEPLPEDIPTRWFGKGSHADDLFSVPSRKEAIKFLKKHGYELRPGAKGSHEKWCQGASGECFILPSRNPLSRNVFGSLLSHFHIDKKHYKEQRLAL